MPTTSAQQSVTSRLQSCFICFLPAVSLVYGCGFLVVFSFFNSYGIDSTDFLKAKYIHVGSLFVLSSLTIAVPLYWLGRAAIPILGRIYTGTQQGTFLVTCKDGLFNWFSPTWPAEQPEGMRNAAATRLSLILMLWSFILLVSFAPAHFGHTHPILMLLDFIIPISVMALGWLGDLFKGGGLPQKQSRFLKWVRRVLRILWIAEAIVFPCLLRKETWFDAHPWRLALCVLAPAALIIVVTLFSLTVPLLGCLSAKANPSTRVAVFRWALYSLQWLAFAAQCCLFFWTVKSGALRIPLLDALLGTGYFPCCDSRAATPSGGIHFALFVTIVVFLFARAEARLKQLAESDSAGSTKALLVSTFAVAVPVLYISVLSFAHNIYSYIPFDKGGGDYSAVQPSHLTFRASSARIALTIPPELVSLNFSNRLLVLDEDSTSVFLADIDDAGGPQKWRSATNRPKVYQLQRDTLSCICRRE